MRRDIVPAIKSRVRDVLRPVPDDLKFRLGCSTVMAAKAARPGFRRLWDAEVRVFSQWGEDGIIDFLLDHLDLPRPSCVEFGAGNFTECNTRFLAEHRAANVLAVDTRTDLVSNIASSPVNWKTTVLAEQTWITPDSAPGLLRRARDAFGTVDLVSLDIDGNDYWVAERCDLTGVSILVVEYNPLFGGERAVSVPRKDDFSRTEEHYSNLYWGASLRAFINLFDPRGFTFVGTNRVGNNAFFIPAHRVSGVGVEVPNPASLDAFVDWRLRESRSESGARTYLGRNEAARLIAHLPLVDLD